MCIQLNFNITCKKIQGYCLTKFEIYTIIFLFCGRGEIGRRAGFRFLWATMGVQVPSSAPKFPIGISPFRKFFMLPSKGLEGGDASGSERFAQKSWTKFLFVRKLNSTVCCSSGRAAKGASPFVHFSTCIINKLML